MPHPLLDFRMAFLCPVEILRRATRALHGLALHEHSGKRWLQFCKANCEMTRGARNRTILARRVEILHSSNPQHDEKSQAFDNNAAGSLFDAGPRCVETQAHRQGLLYPPAVLDLARYSPSPL